MPLLQARFKDSIYLPTKNPAVLMTVISLENHAQEGQKLSYFIDLVNRHFEEKTLKKLIIITTGHLQKHYFSLGLSEKLDASALETKACHVDQQWLEKNKPYLATLRIPVEILSWKALLEKDPAGFSTFLKQMETDYQQNTEFRNSVDKHAGNYVFRKINRYLKANKASSDDFLKVAVNYVLEECAALSIQLFKCGADFLCYPDGKTPPANYVWNHYFKEAPLHYVRYEIKSPEAKPIPIPSRFFISPRHVTTQYTQWALNRVDWNVSQQFRFLQEFNRLLFRINNLSEPSESLSTPPTLNHRRSL